MQTIELILAIIGGGCVGSLLLILAYAFYAEVVGREPRWTQADIDAMTARRIDRQIDEHMETLR